MKNTIKLAPFSFFVIGLMAVCATAQASNTTPSISKLSKAPTIIKTDNTPSTPKKHYFYPAPGIGVHSGYGMSWGQWRVFLGGIDCHIGEGNCQVDGQAGAAIGLGNTKKYVGLEIIPRLNSIGWHDDGFADRGSLSFKLSHNFQAENLSVAFGGYEVTGYITSKFGGTFDTFQQTYYVSLTKQMSLTPKSNNQLMALFTVGAGNGYYATGKEWDMAALKAAHKKILPFFAVGVQLNRYLGAVIEDYNLGYVHAAITIQPLLKWPFKILFGAGDIFTYMQDQERPKLMGSIIFSDYFD